MSYSSRAQVKSGQEVTESLRGFVQDFYDWYVPKALSDNVGPAWNLALQTKSSAFSLQLVQSLREDSAAQTKAKKQIVGLDFDPFLNSQDPGEHYEVGKIRQQGESYWVDIHSVWSGKKEKNPSVVAELIPKNGSWIFVNFHYQEGGDLLAILKKLRESRRVAQV